ncbi:MAG: RsmE family RNA methyltransferase [Nitriliruptor sp.]
MSLAPYLHLDVPLAGRLAGDHVELPPDALHHLTRVLRLRAGAAVVASDGAGSEASGHLVEDGVVLDAAVVTAAPPAPALTVAQALPKGRKLDEVVRQITELGVDRIVPVAAVRSVAALDGERAVKAVERWRAIARAACEQARRPTRPSVAEVTGAARLCAAVPADGRLLVAHVGAARPLVDALGGAAGGGPAITVAIGPEGGWSSEEVAAFEAAGGEVVGLGPTVLRTEHAAAAAVAVVAAVTGRWS